ncbi:MAG: Asp-tRNA(Asn)/Glu-tRNA(Gln) amidotransferase subunit GatB [Bacilli bacterium]|nr:Asp-tRNA(Asn)/Glu-tRNA(Gln) amidotransferase subunit GatB [Bacilli bacterium]
MDFEVTIGLEIHVEMKTKTKMFSATPVAFGAEPNTLTSPYDLAFPGTLPLPNKQAVINAIQVSHALHMKIDHELHFDRKNYFYSDLPKGYQITQNRRPIGSDGYLDIEVNRKTNRVEIERLHLEEDTAKQLHFPNYTLIDYNRAGIPLIEIVTRPCIHSSDVAAKYVETIREIVSFLGVSDGKMEEGQLRCDVNISLRKTGDKQYGTKVEVKNINSFNYIKIALEYEINRQKALLEKGEAIVQETRRYDEEHKATQSMRLKTDSVDYKYFPDANIPIIKLSDEFVNNAIKSSKELASAKRSRYQKEFKLNDYDTGIILSNIQIANYFDECAKLSKHYKSIANWIISDILAILNKNALTIDQFEIKPKTLVSLIEEIESGKISNKIGREIFNYMINNHVDIKTAKEKLNITNQQSDDKAIRTLVIEVLDNNAQSIKDYHAGKDRALGFLIGQVMKKSGGKVNPALTSKIMIEELNRRK